MKENKTKEIYQKYQKDEYNIIDAKVIDIAKSIIDNRKVVILQREDGTKLHLESPKGTRLTIAEQFKYILPKKDKINSMMGNK